MSSDYRRGFEDALEFALDLATQLDSSNELRKKLIYVLGLLKDKKFYQLQQELGAVL